MKINRNGASAWFYCAWATAFLFMISTMISGNQEHFALALIGLTITMGLGAIAMMLQHIADILQEKR